VKQHADFVHNFAISLDGYGAGPNQDLDNPLGVGGLALHDWILPTRTFQLAKATHFVLSKRTIRR
jgi:hypothetical protein